VARCRRWPGSCGERVDPRQQAAQPNLGTLGGVRQVMDEPDPSAVNTAEMADQADAAILQRAQVDIPAIEATGELQGRLRARRRPAMPVHAPVQRTQRIQPPHDVHAAVAARQAGVRPDREDHPAPGVDQLVGQLHPRWPRRRRRAPRRPAAPRGLR
jgi:hypothetical protein